MSTTSLFRTWGIPLSVIAVLLGGCGGGGAGNASVAPSNQGKMALSVKWPARTSRLIPADANDVRFLITPVGQGTAQAVWVVRPAGNNAATSTTYSAPLLPGTYTIQADAFQNATGTGANETPVGASLSSGTVNNQVVTAGNATTFSVTLGTTLSKFLIQGFPYYSDATATSIWVDTAGKLTTNSTNAGDQKPSAIPFYSGISTPYTITVTPEDADGDVLLLSAAAAGQTTISVTHPGSSSAINISTTGSTTTQTPPDIDQYTFAFSATGTVSTDEFEITYSDGSTTLNFPVAVTATTPASGVSLQLTNTPPNFDAGGAQVLATAQLTEVDSLNNVIQVFNGIPTAFGAGTVTFSFGIINSTPNDFIYSYTLNLITVGGAAVPVASFTSGKLAYPAGLAFPSHDASGDNLALTFPSPTGASVTPSADAATFSAGGSAQALQVTASFGAVTDTFPASLFTETASTGLNLYSFTSGNLSPKASLPSSLTNQQGTLALGYQVRNSGGATVASGSTGTFDVWILPTAGTGSITIQ